MGSPAEVACNPGEARVKWVKTIINSSTDNQPPPRQEGEAVVSPWSGQIRDGAGVGRREKFDAGDDLVVTIEAAHHHLPCIFFVN